MDDVETLQKKSFDFCRLDCFYRVLQDGSVAGTRSIWVRSRTCRRLSRSLVQRFTQVYIVRDYWLFCVKIGASTRQILLTKYSRTVSLS